MSHEGLKTGVRIKALNHSLNLRLLLFAGLAIAMALTAAWIVLGLLFERHSERQLQAELERHGMALIAAVEFDPGERPIVARQPSDPRFLRPASGLYWRIVAPGGELRSRSLWDGLLAPPGMAGSRTWTAFNVKGPFEDQVLVIARRVQIGTRGPQVVIEIAADRMPVTQGRADFGIEMAIFLAVLWLALTFGAWAQVRMGLRPLHGVSKELDAMSRAVDARLAVSDHPVEIRPLTGAINAVAERRAQDITRARQRARDLAHALKTPITALRLQIEDLPADKAKEMMVGLTLISGAVESELARTGASSEGETVDARSIIERLYTVIARTPDGARVALLNRVATDFDVPLGTEAALEAFGAVLENAARHALTSVEVVSGSDANFFWIEVSDDGAGIPEELRAAMLVRGGRQDVTDRNQGLGLSIAWEIVAASGGDLSLATGQKGGLVARFAWPKSPTATVAPR